MNTYSVKIVTKLDSSFKKKIVAATEEEALEAARKRFPLHKEVWVFDTQESSDEEVRREEVKSSRGVLNANATKTFQPVSAEGIRLKELASGKLKMVGGAFWWLLGTVVTVATINEGGGYVLFWGAIGYGLIDFIIGFSRWKANKEPIS